MKLAMTNFSLRHPRIVVLAVLVITAFMAAQFPKVTFDNDPENMLSEDEYVRRFHHEVKERFGLYDFVIVGIVNEAHEDGIFNVDTLGRIHRLTTQLLNLRPSAEGLPSVSAPDSGGEVATRVVDLTSASAWRRGLNVAFRHNPNALFDEEGRSVIIAREIISPSVVDNIKQAELGSLKMEYLMESAPASREEALTIRDDAMGNPLYAGTLVSEDEKAICLYLPLQAKTYSYNVAALVQRLTQDWPDEDRVFITGLPVAEDTFGVEMLVQMASSAPLAGLAIFLLLLLFFRRISLIIAPMLVAVFSVLCTMGLLIGLGFDVHIMSSMIAIFLMPIAVADSVHILSEFFDVYHRFGDKKEAVRHVVGHLFMPMLYTSLTTIAGFASLAMTPIPPVRIFGLHVAFGVAMAWALTMTFVPAYILLAVPERTLRKGRAKQGAADPHGGVLSRGLAWLGVFSYRRWRAILLITVVVLGVSGIGISRIVVNDNPVKWFTPAHPIREADRILNAHFGGTYTAYLTLSQPTPQTLDCHVVGAALRTQAHARFAEVFPEATQEFVAALAAVQQQYMSLNAGDANACLVELVNRAEAIDTQAAAPWNALADEIVYLEPDGLTWAVFKKAVDGVASAGSQRAILLGRLAKDGGEGLQGAVLQNHALAICDEYAGLSFREFVLTTQAELTAPVFKQPVVLAYVEALQAHLLENAVVGKTSSAVDALKKAAYELRYVAAPADADANERASYEQRNAANYAVPATASGAGQVYTQLEGMKKKDSLFHLVTKDYAEANIWVQLKSGDNRDMEAVVKDVERYMRDNPPPAALRAEWAGLTYLNVVWQDKMVRGMLSSLGSSFVVVLIMMMVLFRSPLYGLLSMIPLSVTISFIYGLIGFGGKDYDMPVAVLSALTLGLSVDFAIHFLQRARELEKEMGSWQKACVRMFQEPAMAISRNAITISIGFTPLLVAPLVPYRTVGFFLATIMAVSWVATLFILAALVTMLQRSLFRMQDAARNG